MYVSAQLIYRITHAAYLELGDSGNWFTSFYRVLQSKFRHHEVSECSGFVLNGGFCSCRMFQFEDPRQLEQTVRRNVQEDWYRRVGCYQSRRCTCPITVHFTGVFNWLHNVGSHDAVTQAKTLLEKAVLSKLSTDGAHSVDECEFANAMYHAQMTGQMFAGKLPNFGQYPEKQTPVVVKG